MPQPLQQLPGSMTRLHSDSSVGSVTLVTRIKSGISNGSKAPKSVGLDEELREGFEAHDVALKPTSSPQLVSSAKVIV